jgi:DNA-directed RNA polymerase specialized sigma24 family protein
LLVIVAVRKCRRQWRLFHGAGRNVRREQVQAAADDSLPSWEALDREPLPDEAVALGDLLEQLLSRLGPRDRVILELRLQGHEIKEICAQANRSERAVYRVLGEARQQLRDLLKNAGGDE